MSVVRMIRQLGTVGAVIIAGFVGMVLGVGPAATASAQDNRSWIGSRMLQHNSAYSVRYVALGDSVAAGLGLPPVSDPTADDAVCGRSTGAYSELVALRLNELASNIPLHVDAINAACQRAVVDSLTSAQMVSDRFIAPQLDQAFSQGTPALISLTLGANDTNWATFIGACFSANNCDTPENTAAVQQYINAMQEKMTFSLGDIQRRSGFWPPIVVVTGYYNPVSAQCTNAAFTANEVAWLTAQTEKMNKALKDASRQAGWNNVFAPVSFEGHDICSSDSWIKRPGVAGELAPFHPTARGQQAIADAVLRAIGL